MFAAIPDAPKRGDKEDISEVGLRLEHTLALLHGIAGAAAGLDNDSREMHQELDEMAWSSVEDMLYQARQDAERLCRACLKGLQNQEGAR